MLIKAITLYKSLAKLPQVAIVKKLIQTISTIRLYPHRSQYRQLFVLLLISHHLMAYEEIYSSQFGLSGSIFTPSPYVQKIDHNVLRYTVNIFDERDNSTLQYETGARHLAAFNASATSNIECGAFFEYYTGASARRERLHWTMKYNVDTGSFPLALSFVVPSSKIDYSSAMVSIGWNAFYFGIGSNYGGRKLEELNFTSVNDFGSASFGGYRLRSILAKRNVQTNQSLVEGKPDPFFAFAGGQVPLGKNVHFLYDYNGDIVASGFRFSLDASTFEINYVSNGDYDRLFGRRQSNIIASAQYRF